MTGDDVPGRCGRCSYGRIVVMTTVDEVVNPPSPSGRTSGPTTRSAPPSAGTPSAAAWLDSLGRGSTSPTRRSTVMPPGTGRARRASRLIGQGRRSRDVTYAELAQLTSRFAGRARPARRRRRRERLRAASAGARAVRRRARHVEAPQRGLHPVLGLRPRTDPPATLARGGKVLVTTTALYERKVAAPPGGAARPPPRARDRRRRRVTARHDRRWGPCSLGARRRTRSPRQRPRTRPCCTSPAARPGTPKGALHVHEAVVAHHTTGRLALDLHPDDVFWCTADPGWVTGTSYGIVAPLTHGVTCIVDEGDFDADRWYRILQRAAGDRLVHGADRDPSVDARWRRVGARVRPVARCAWRPASVSRFTPKASVWGMEAIGRPFHDNWWQTETGGIMVANIPASRSDPARWAAPCRASRRPSCAATTKATPAPPGGCGRGRAGDGAR